MWFYLICPVGTCGFAYGKKIKETQQKHTNKHQPPKAEYMENIATQ